jgi:hypothetical protein
MQFDNQDLDQLVNKNILDPMGKDKLIVLRRKHQNPHRTPETINISSLLR